MFPRRRDRKGGEQEKGVVFHPARRGEKQHKNQFFSPFPMRSSGKGAGGTAQRACGMGFAARANASCNLDAFAMEGYAPLLRHFFY